MRSFITSVLIIVTLLPCAMSSCADAAEMDAPAAKSEVVPQRTKPPSSFQDTLFVKNRSAIFYEPDSLQLLKIRELTSNNVYESSMHEYEYQFRNAKNLLNLYWKDVKILEAKKIRYLHFVLSGGKTQTIDLDKFNDAFGLFVFDPSKPPRPIEMTNAGSLIPDYFERN